MSQRPRVLPGELKSLEKLAPVHSKKLLTYLKLSNKQVGLQSTSEPQPQRKASTASSTAFPPPPLRASA